MRKKIYMLATLAVALLMVSCEDDYKLYDTNQTDSVFFNYLNEKQTADSVITYSFDYDIAQSHIIDIPVSLMGIPKAEARRIELEVVKDSTDMVEGVNYTIERAEMAANGDLRPTGQNTFTIKYSDIHPDRPKWWATFNPLPVYSYENAQLFFKYFYELAPKANKAVFDELITKYGDYFIKAKDMEQGGPMAFYDAFLAKYVLIPMYNDTKDVIEWQDVPKVN